MFLDMQSTTPKVMGRENPFTNLKLNGFLRSRTLLCKQKQIQACCSQKRPNPKKQKTWAATTATQKKKHVARTNLTLVRTFHEMIHKTHLSRVEQQQPSVPPNTYSNDTKTTQQQQQHHAYLTGKRSKGTQLPTGNIQKRETDSGILQAINIANLGDLCWQPLLRSPGT